jgi:hypothetical protein
MAGKYTFAADSFAANSFASNSWAGGSEVEVAAVSGCLPRRLLLMLGGGRRIGSTGGGTPGIAITRRVHISRSIQRPVTITQSLTLKVER